MSRFLTKLRTESLSPDELKMLKSDRQLYRLTDDFVVESTYLGRTFAVPAGFVTDLASIPRFAYRVIAPDDPCIEYPSVPHDCLYKMMGNLNGMTYERSDADHVLEELMELAGASWFIRKAVFSAVRIGGGSHWNPKPYKE